MVKRMSIEKLKSTINALAMVGMKNVSPAFVQKLLFY
jgi:hypothetical protein